MHNSPSKRAQATDTRNNRRNARDEFSPLTPHLSDVLRSLEAFHAVIVSEAEWYTVSGADWITISEIHGLWLSMQREYRGGTSMAGRSSVGATRIHLFDDLCKLDRQPLQPIRYGETTYTNVNVSSCCYSN